MKKLITLFCFTLMAFACKAQNSNNLYPFNKGELWGYINKKGEIAIKPQFYAAGKFTEGLAAVRSNGRYGFIDSTGKFILEPVYDFAYPFQNNLSKIYLSGKPFIIDRQGHTIFQHSYARLDAFGTHSFSRVATASNKFGVVDKNGLLIADTIYKDIRPFVDGMAIVLLEKNHKRLTGIIDSTGKPIVKLNRYESISDFKNGFAEAELIKTLKADEGWSDSRVILNKKGRELFNIISRKYSLKDEARSNPSFYDEIAPVKIYSKNVDLINHLPRNMRYDFAGAINSSGKILFSDSSWKEITGFSFNRSFVLDTTDHWRIIDKKGKFVSDERYEEIDYDIYDEADKSVFINGSALVKTSMGWSFIDTTGKHISDYQTFDDFADRDISRVKDIVILHEDASTKDKIYPHRYGFWNPKINVVILPEFQDIDPDAFEDSLIRTIKDNKTFYINAAGKIIWEERDTQQSNRLLNIDHMNRGYFYASSESKSELNGFGGWGGSGNKSKKITKEFASIKNKFQIILDTTKKSGWNKYQGFKVFIVNTLTDTAFFEAQDSRLYMTLQAYASDNTWKDIEYLPSSWCGNSYHNLFLATNEFWEFSAPFYKGELKTKIRAKLLFKKNLKQKNRDVLYSNEIDGSVNPAQFWRTLPYISSGLMDPYNN